MYPILYFSDEQEQGGVANDSDSSPPRSRGRGRLEKERIKVGSRGQSEDTRSTSSQGVDDESSSHVRPHTHTHTPTYKTFALNMYPELCVCLSEGQVPSEGLWGRWPALWLLPLRRGGERDAGRAPCR